MEYRNNYEPQQYPPDSGMVWAILTTLFCCLPFGIVAIVYASKVNNLWMMGYYDGARAAARTSKNWSLAAAISCVVIWILYIVFFTGLIGLGMLL